MSIDETLDTLISNDNLSIIRFGDGEFLYLIDKLNLPFQEYDEKLASTLKTILKNENPNILVGLPNAYHSLHEISKSSRLFWRAQISWIYPRLRNHINIETHYANASITRLYYEFESKDLSSERFAKFKQLWDGENVVLIEGEKSRFGVGNDLLSSAASVKRILGPMHHAYRRFKELIECTCNYSKSNLILIAMGPCAKALAYVLVSKGYRVIDVGNLDIEYEWFLNKADKKTKIQGKYTSEAKGGRIVEDIEDSVYKSQIVKKVT